MLLNVQKIKVMFMTTANKVINIEDLKLMENLWKRLFLSRTSAISLHLMLNVKRIMCIAELAGLEV